MQQRTLDILDKVLYGLIIALFVVIPFSEAGINIFAGLILIVLVATFVITRSVRGLDRGIWQPILALLIAGLLSLFFAADKGRGLHKFLSPLVKYVTVFVAVALTARTDSRRRWLTAIMLVTGLISAGYGIYQYGWLSIRRVYSFSYNPNVVAGYFAVLTALECGITDRCQESVVAVRFLLYHVARAWCNCGNFFSGCYYRISGIWICPVHDAYEQSQEQESGASS